ncbi:unnamed protein product [Thelazia callipaeda]|uniref:Secreted protein n=1 Tax=Thelazia callipaeda TaxID=103827 RepID=A0A0N5CKG4_THECL|nr:unnamed protein product [Thelazia callipaeda]
MLIGRITVVMQTYFSCVYNLWYHRSYSPKPPSSTPTLSSHLRACSKRPATVCAGCAPPVRWVFVSAPGKIPLTSFVPTSSFNLLAHPMAKP